jgi:hypothetical protein
MWSGPVRVGTTRGSQIGAPIRSHRNGSGPEQISYKILLFFSASIDSMPKTTRSSEPEVKGGSPRRTKTGRIE